MVNTVAPYRSPVRLVRHAAEEAEGYSSQAVTRARKKLMAEISLSGDEIVIDGIAYSRNDASALLDGMTEEGWKVHSVVYAHRGLLDFLEKEDFNDAEIKKADAWLYNERFVQAVSPYFAHSFNAVSGRLLKAGDFAELVKLQNYTGYLLPEHSGEGYQKIRTYFADLSYTLRNLSWEKFAADESVLHFVFSDSWKQAVNKLPPSFATLRDDVVEQLINLVIHFQHKATWHYLHQLLVQLRGIETSDFNRSEVERIDKVIARNSHLESSGRLRKSTGENKSEWASGRALWWVMWLILAVVRAATCNNQSSNKLYSFEKDAGLRQIGEIQKTNTDEKRNEPLLLHFLDSLSSKPSLPVEAGVMHTGSQPFSSFADNFSESGADTVTVTNNTTHNCVMLCFDGASQAGSVYQGALSHTRAVYIRRGETYTFTTTPLNGVFYFLFGDAWGKLKKQAELPIYSDHSYADEERYQQLLFVYEFFSSRKPVKQNLLQRGLYLDDTNGTQNEDRYEYLNVPAPDKKVTDLDLTETNGVFLIKAESHLSVKADRKTAPDAVQKSASKTRSVR